MSVVSVMIVDDEALARERLQQLVDALPGYEVQSSCASAAEAMDQLRESVPDVVLLDISMPGMSGMDLARYLRGMDPAPALIFCTAHDEFALDAFDAGAAAYLLKPVREGKLLESLENARRANRLQVREAQPALPRSENFCVESHRGVALIPVESVSHLIADQKYVTLFHGDGETLMETSLRAIEQQYPDRFLRLHRNTLANVDYIAGIKRNAAGESFLRLRGIDTEPRISRRHVREIKQFLAGE